MYEDLAKELKRNTHILHSTFEQFNLKVLQVAYKPYGIEGAEEPNADCDCLVELVSMNDEPMSKDAYIKVNLYDADENLISHDYQMIMSRDFSGYDTYSIYITNDSKTLLLAKSARVYLSKGI